MKRSLVVFSMFSMILLTSMVSSASASSAWTQPDHLPYVRHTASNPGSVKICGDHICKPFEDSKKSLVIQNTGTQFVKQNHPVINKPFNKTVVQIDKSLTSSKKE